MKKLTLVLVALSLTACASKPPVKAEPVKVEKTDNLQGPKLSGYNDVEYMNRSQVIQASKDCINARMRPVVQYVPQKTQFGTVMLPAVVNCEIYNQNQH